LAVGCWILAVGCWVGCWLLAVGWLFDEQVRTLKKLGITNKQCLTMQHIDKFGIGACVDMTLQVPPLLLLFLLCNSILSGIFLFKE
jgi:hypothetical protein